MLVAMGKRVASKAPAGGPAKKASPSKPLRSISVKQKASQKLRETFKVLTEEEKHIIVNPADGLT